jgi:plastocyanin
MRRARLAVFAIALAVIAPVALAACGGDDDDEQAATTETTAAPAGEGTTLQLAADPGGAFKFDKKSLNAPAGAVTIDFDNPASLSHDVVIEQGDREIAKSDVISKSTTTVTATLEAGKYVFFCDIPGHREGGMEGTLTVK